MKFFISCEHGGNQVPALYTSIFEGNSDLLASHRGWDPGALELYGLFKNEFTTFECFSQVSRLLVDLNRGLRSRTLFSEFSSQLNPAQREEVLTRYYHPYRSVFLNRAREVIEAGNSLFHLSVHTFEPILKGVKRDADIGILYDPSREKEKHIARLWKSELAMHLPGFKVRFNYPYLGKSDGHVTELRGVLGNNYLGVEFELNNMHRSRHDIMLKVGESYRRLCNMTKDW